MNKKAEFEIKSNLTHPIGEFNYDKVVINKNFKEKVTITHNICGNSFEQRAAYHMQGGGCGYCSGRLESKKTFLTKLRNIYQEMYDLSKVEYKGTFEEVELKCNSCGTWFFKKPSYLVNNISNIHCPKCSLQAKQINKRVCSEEDRFLSNFEYFVKRANEVHRESYTYHPLEIYPANNKEKIEILCNLHGKFLQRIDCHLNGQGCPSCVKRRSNGELEVEEYIKSIISNEIQNQVPILGRQHIDIYVPSLKIGIEYNGLYYHDKDDKYYHLNKTKLAMEKGIKLIHIFEDEWIHKKEIVKNRLKSIFGVSEKINARDTEVKSISFSRAKIFLLLTHLQGYSGPTSYNYGLFYKEEMVAVITFSKSRFDKLENKFELIRFSSDKTITGGFSKLLNHFIKEIRPCGIITYADIRWSQGKVYLANGFVQLKSSEPSPYWCKAQVRYHRMNFQKHKLPALFKDKYNDNLTPDQNCVNNGYTKVYDCGHLKFEMNLMDK